MIIRNEKYQEVPKGVYAITVKAKHINDGKYDFFAFKVKTLKGKYIDLKICYFDTNTNRVMAGSGDFEDYFMAGKEFKIYVTKEMLEYTVNDKGFYICKLLDYVSIVYDED